MVIIAQLAIASQPFFFLTTIASSCSPSSISTSQIDDDVNGLHDDQCGNGGSLFHVIYKTYAIIMFQVMRDS